ncbi:MAG: hypothetical protein IPG50_15370 [Myxococcales bacterium]|nr:hypothetical protein [Myxococcales bacterium]
MLLARSALLSSLAFAVACGAGGPPSAEDESNLESPPEQAPPLLTKTAVARFAADEDRVYVGSAMNPRIEVVRLDGTESSRVLWDGDPRGAAPKVTYLQGMTLVGSDLVFVASHEDRVERVWRLPKGGGAVTLLAKAALGDQGVDVAHDAATRRLYVSSDTSVLVVSLIDGATSSLPTGRRCHKTLVDEFGALCVPRPDEVQEAFYADFRAPTPAFAPVTFARGGLVSKQLALRDGRVYANVDEPGRRAVIGQPNNDTVVAFDAKSGAEVTAQRGPNRRLGELEFGRIAARRDGTVCITAGRLFCSTPSGDFRVVATSQHFAFDSVSQISFTNARVVVASPYGVVAPHLMSTGEAASANGAGAR